ncbi:MAG: hypothetical protein C5B51_04725 [Terriglobia bacterium]|nr:MAG: hypothetical protein C5B51_04725 [Terriglobia bacterium]
MGAGGSIEHNGAGRWHRHAGRPGTASLREPWPRPGGYSCPAIARQRSHRSPGRHRVLVSLYRPRGLIVPDSTKQRSRVLIVEDEGIVATDIRTCLEDYGYEVTGIAASSDDAILEASKTCPDLVLMDVRIQGDPDGIETADILHRRFGVPVMFLTAHSDPETIERAKKTEPIAFLLKPFKKIELVNGIEIALRRVHAERELREQERWLVTAMGSIGDAVFSTDEHGRVRFLNRAAQILTGATLEQALGVPVTEVVQVAPEDLRGFRAALGLETAENGSRAKPEYRVVAAAGDTRWITARATKMEGLEGRPIRIAVMQDITARKQAERVLRRQSDLLDQSREPVFTWEFGGCIDYWNHGAERLYGFSREEALGRDPHELLRTSHPMGIPEIDGVLEREGQWSGELVHTTKDGWEIIVESLMVMVKEPDGRKTVLETNRDISERKRVDREIRWLNADLEKRVRDRTAQLEAANKELESFAHSVSHDLRAPLRGIDGWSLALIEDYSHQLDQQARQYLDRVRSETQRMGSLIDDLLQLSRVTRAEMERQAVDLTAVARNIAARLREAHADRHIEFEIQPGMMASGDPRLLEIALTNLFSNAVKFTGRRVAARIGFEERLSEGEPVFCVRDNGAGFDMAYASNLFGAFQRLHKMSEFPGTGIGLATVQRIIRRHGGRVWAEAQPDQGAAFYFTIGT